MKTRFWITILWVLSLGSSLHGIDDLRLHLKVIALDKASSPEFYFGKILFTASPEENTRHVAIAFAHEQYQVLHSFQRNQNGLFFYLLDVPDLEFLEYRMIVDGIWQPDPMAENQIRDINGLKLSRLTIPENQRSRRASPLVGDQGMVTFYLEGLPGSMVYLAGDFNQWDPYMIPMKEIRQGLFEIRLKLSPGTHFYNYFVNGEVLLDPLNRNVKHNTFGEEVSYLTVP